MDNATRRHRTGLEWAALVSQMAGAAVVVGGIFGWAFDALPVVKAAEFNREISGIKGDVRTLQAGLHDISRSQSETQELQLMDRVQQLSDRLAKMRPDADDYQDWRQQRNEAQQRLDRVRLELADARQP